MRRLLLPLVLLLAVVLLSGSDATAAGTPTGIRNAFTVTPLAMPYLSKDGHALVAARSTPSYTAGATFSNVFRADMIANAGGVYGGGIQSAYFGFNAEVDMGTAGQAGALWGYVQGRGKGNAIFGNSVVDCYGGGAVSLPDATPECSPLGEYEMQTGTKVWRATVTGAPAANATTISFTGALRPEVIGQRLLLNSARTYSTGTFASFTSTQILNFAGSNFTGLSPSTGWYLKMGSTAEGYAAPCVGSDVLIDSLCVGHWYRVTGFGSATQLTLDTFYDDINLSSTPGASYVLMQAAEITGFTTSGTTGTITLPANGYAWQNGDTLISPPNHIMGIVGLNLIFHKAFKTGIGTAPSYGIRLVNYGPEKMERGLWISGSGADGGYQNGIYFSDFNGVQGYGINAANTDFSGGIMAIRQSNGSNNKILWGSNGEAQQYYDGTSIHIGAGATVAIDKGLAPNGSGAKHKRAAVGCTTAASVGATCTSAAQSWTSAFADTDYTLSCTLDGPTGVPVVSSVTKAAGNFTITIAALTAAAATGTYNCTAVHD